MKEYGIMEILLLTKKQMRAEDRKQEIYLEWPNMYHIRVINKIVSRENVLYLNPPYIYIYIADQEHLTLPVF